MTDDYKAALESLPKLFDEQDETVGDFRARTCQWFATNYMVVARALLIADRLEQEPSVSMLSKLDNGFLTSLSADAFKAMRDQLLKEIEYERCQK